MKYHIQFSIKSLALKQGGFSERRFADKVKISRTGLRSLLLKDQAVSLHSMVKVAAYLNRNIHILAISDETITEMSTLAVAYKVLSQEFNSWKIHFMDFVDEFRRTLDPQLFLLAPPKELDYKLKALLASIVVQLCIENSIDPPSWAEKMHFLNKPWFVSGMESLKATALQESPLAFRRNNIFVQENFLERA